uniref:Uncharacterized protein n=1 Tax=Cucumis melo TaxID=3656 RepID=A0A9I9EI89_CUCME
MQSLIILASFTPPCSPYGCLYSLCAHNKRFHTKGGVPTQPPLFSNFAISAQCPLLFNIFLTHKAWPSVHSFFKNLWLNGDSISCQMVENGEGERTIPLKFCNTQCTSLCSIVRYYGEGFPINGEERCNPLPRNCLTKIIHNLEEARRSLPLFSIGVKDLLATDMKENPRMTNCGSSNPTEFTLLSLESKFKTTVTSREVIGEAKNRFFIETQPPKLLMTFGKECSSFDLYVKMKFSILIGRSQWNQFPITLNQSFIIQKWINCNEDMKEVFKSDLNVSPKVISYQSSSH